MPVLAFSLLFGSAVLHTTWNLLLKQAGEKYIATWWAILLGSGVFLPFLFFTGLPASETWLFLLVSALIEAAYYLTLSTAYRDADFSLVYPLARGTAPGLIAIWSVLFLGEKLTSGGFFGLGIIIAGLLIIGGANLFQRRQERPHIRGVVLSLILAFLISVYSTIDGAAVKHTQPFPYAVLIFFLTPTLTTPLVFHRYGWPLLKSELACHWKRILSIGLLSVVAYLLALVAYSIAAVSYAGAVREISVVLGAFVGWRFLGEKLGRWRVVGSLIIFSGIILIALYG